MFNIVVIQWSDVPLGVMSFKKLFSFSKSKEGCIFFYYFFTIAAAYHFDTCRYVIMNIERQNEIKHAIHKECTTIAYLNLLNFRKLSYLQIFLFDEDKKIANKVCSATTDPRMSTFDGKSWTASLSGEFVMYRDSRRQIAVSTKLHRLQCVLLLYGIFVIWNSKAVVFVLTKVHALFSTCNMDVWSWSWFPPCICGIAVRVKNSLYVYRTCEEISNRYAKPLIHHNMVYQICDNRHMVVDIGDLYTKVFKSLLKIIRNGNKMEYYL